jgi:hypothetical protein
MELNRKNEEVLRLRAEILHKPFLLNPHLIHRGADKSLAFPISYFPICTTTKRIFFGWVK